MTIRECYALMDADFDDVMGRLQKESLVERFFLRFESDNSMNLLRTSMNDNNIEECFLAVHSLKSVAGNLSLTALAKASSELTEQLRSRTEAPRKELVDALENEYEKVLGVLNKFKTENQQ